MKNYYKVIKIFNINFYNISFNYLIKKFNQGIVIMFPAAPALVNIYKDKEYRDALANANYVLFDSGYLCLLLLFLKKIYVEKYSGLKFLREMINFLSNKKHTVLMIDTNEKNKKKNISFFKKKNIKNVFSYIAPIYKSNINDEKLIDKINLIKPKFIIINLGGGTQEKLAIFVKNKIKHKCSIICTGAAIAFLTGEQAKIPPFIDKLFLGWFFRILFSPKLYLGRYLKSIRLFFMIYKIKKISVKKI